MQEQNTKKCNLIEKNPNHADYVKNKNHILFGELIIERKLKLNDVAKMLGITGCYVHNLKEGRRNPSGKLAIKIRDLFGLPVENWFC